MSFGLCYVYTLSYFLGHYVLATTPVVKAEDSIQLCFTQSKLNEISGPKLVMFVNFYGSTVSKMWLNTTQYFCMALDLILHKGSGFL